MMHKTSTLVSVFAVLLLSLSFASAALIITPTGLSDSVVQGNSKSFSLNIFNDNNSSSTTVTIAPSVLSSSTNTISTGSQLISSPTVTIPAQNSSNITYTVNIQSNQPTGVYTGNLTLSRTPSGVDIIPVQITVTAKPQPSKNYCSNGTVGDLEIKDFDITNDGEGDDNDWQPLDSITIDVDIKNTNVDDDVQDVLVEIKILDENNKDVTSDFNIKDEEIDLGRINNKDTETATFLIDEVPADLDEGTYKIYIKAYSEDEEELQCVDESSILSDKTYEEVSFSREEDAAVVVRPLDIKNALTATCGEKNLEVAFPVYNIGVDKEEKVLVNLYSKELGIDEYQVIDNLRSGKRKDVSFLVSLPEQLSKPTYKLEVITFFEYDEGDELEPSNYDSNSKDDLEESYKLTLNVLTCKAPEPSVTANLESDAKLGSELTVRFQVTNPGSQVSNFVFSLEGYESWAELISITPETQNIKAGASSDVLVKLMPISTGPQKMTLNVVTDGTAVTRDVAVKVAGGEEKSNLFDFSNDKVVLYLIIGIAALIVLIFVALLIRGSRKE